MAQNIAQPPANIRRRPEQPVRAGDIEIEVAVAAGTLDQRRVLQGVLQAAAQSLLVLFRPGWQDQGLTAAIPGDAELHSLAHPLAIGFIAHVIDHRP